MKSIKLSPISKKYYKDQHHEHHHHIHNDHSDHAYHDKHHHKSNYHDDSHTIDSDSNTPILEWHRVMKKLERLRVTNGVIFIIIIIIVITIIDLIITIIIIINSIVWNHYSQI